MTIVAIWCRHKEDNIIGIGPHIPWYIPSDFKRFKRITSGNSIIAGERTYETFPNRTLPNRKIYVLTFNPNYEVSDKVNHFVKTSINDFQNTNETIYLCGGASVYKSFVNVENNNLPSMIVDSEYQGELKEGLEGQPVDLTSCVETMKEHYLKISKDYLEDNVITSVWVRKDIVYLGKAINPNYNELVECYNKIIEAIENKG